MTTPDRDDTPPKPDIDPEEARAYLAEFDRQVRRLWPRILDVYLSVVDPEDVVASAIKSVVRVKGMPADEAGWRALRPLLNTAVNRKLYAKIRLHSAAKRNAGKNVGQAAVLDPGQVQSPDGDAVAAELLLKVMDGLGATEWQVFDMLVAGHTLDEIATAIGRGKSTAFRVVKLLRERATEYLEATDGPAGSAGENH